MRGSQSWGSSIQESARDHVRIWPAQIPRGDDAHSGISPLFTARLAAAAGAGGESAIGQFVATGGTIRSHGVEFREIRVAVEYDGHALIAQADG